MKYLKIFTDFADDIEPLSDEERGRLFTAMLRYADSAEVIELPGNERYLWPLAKRYIDTQAESYRKKCDANLRNITKRYEPLRTATNGYDSKQDKDKGKDNKEILSKESTKKFVPPTVEDVRSYITESGYTVDPERFVDYYSSNGWKVGKNAMKDWKAAVRTWQTKEPKKTQYSNSELEKLEIVL